MSSSPVLSDEKLQRAKEYVYQLADLHAKVGRRNSISADVYPACKGMANWIESVAREEGIRPSELERIDLKTGKVFRRRGGAVETSRRSSNDTRRRAGTGRQARSS